MNMPAKKDFWAYDLFADSIIKFFATVIIAASTNGRLSICRWNMRKLNIALSKFFIIRPQIWNTAEFYSVYFFYGIIGVNIWDIV